MKIHETSLLDSNVYFEFDDAEEKKVIPHHQIRNSRPERRHSRRLHGSDKNHSSVASLDKLFN